MNSFFDDFNPQKQKGGNDYNSPSKKNQHHNNHFFDSQLDHHNAYTSQQHQGFQGNQYDEREKQKTEINQSLEVAISRTIAQKKGSPLYDALDEIESRFLLNFPENELYKVDRVFFQIEQGHWYYEDYFVDQGGDLKSKKKVKQEKIFYVGRSPAASPAAGSLERHLSNQETIIKMATEDSISKIIKSWAGISTKLKTNLPIE